MPRVILSNTVSATLIFDLEDRFLREQRIAGPHPRPFGPVRLFLLGPVAGGARQPFAEPQRLLTRQTPSGYLIFFGQSVDARGSRRRLDLTPGTYSVRAEGDAYQPVERDDIALPRRDSAYFFDLAPGFNYPFPAGASGPTLLRGDVRAADGTGVAGALVSVLGERLSYRTDASGQWVLVVPSGQAAARVEVRALLPDGRSLVQSNIPVEPGSTTSVPPFRVP